MDFYYRSNNNKNECIEICTEMNRSLIEKSRRSELLSEFIVVDESMRLAKEFHHGSTGEKE